MDLDFQFEATIEIKPDELKKILTQHIEKNGTLKVVSVDFKISSQSVGYGPGEHDIKVFDSAKIKVQPVQKDFE